MSINPALDAAIFVVSALIGLRASVALITKLERLGERVGLTEAMLGLLAALCADAPEITSAVTALVRGQKEVGVGVVLGSNVFNLAALLGLGAVVAGRIALHRRVIVFDGAVGLWMAGVTIATLAGLAAPATGLVLVLAVLVPYIAASAVGTRRLARLRLPSRWRLWLVRAVREEEAELAGAVRPGPGGRRDLAGSIVALLVVVAASAAMESSGAAFGSRYGVPDIVIGGVVLAAVTSLPNAVAAIHLASRGRGAATLATTLNSNTLNVVAGLFVPAAVTGLGPRTTAGVLAAAWFCGLTLVTLGLAFVRRGLGRAEGGLVLSGYVAFVLVLVAR